MSDAIDRYLDELYAELRVTPSQARRLLRETEDHLREEQERLVREGTPPGEAAGAAIARFGPARAVARAAGREDPSGHLLAIAGSAAVGVLGLLAVGLVAIGVSGILAWAFGEWFGQEFVAGDQAGVTYTPERCAQFFRFEPDAPDCASAAVEHHFAETIAYRLAAGVLGIFIGLVALAARPLGRRGPDLRGFVAAAGFALFTAGALGLLGLGGLSYTDGDSDGSGMFLSGGIVALPVAAIFGIVLARWLLRSRHRLTQ